MAPSSDENQNFPRTSSPTPIRDTQPQRDSPTTTARGTQRGHAEFDTPPEGTQPIELQRSGRSRKLSSRAQEIIASGKPLAGHSNAAEPEPPQPTESAPKSRPNGSQQPKKRTRATLKFDGERSSEELEPPAGVALRPPHKRGKKAHSPPPKPPGRTLSMVRASTADKYGFRVKGDAASGLSEFLGVDPRTATTRAINEKILSLSDHRAPQVEAEGRYTKTQVRGEPPAPLSPLSQKRGGYSRDKLLALGHPKPSDTKRPLSDGDSGPSKRTRFDEELESSAIYNPAFRGDVLSLPSFTTREPVSTSSTQRATVHTLGSQRPQVTERFRFGAGLTPIPEPRRDLYSQPTARRAPSPKPRAPPPATRALPPGPRTRPHDRHPPAAPVQPRVLVPGTPSRSPSPPQRHLKSPLAKPPTKSHPDKRKPPPRKKLDAAIESGTEPEPVAGSKSKRHTRHIEVGRAGGRPSLATAGPSTRHPSHTPPRQRTGAAQPTRHRDVESILDRLGDILNGGDSGNESDDPAVDQVIELLLQRRHRTRPSSSRHEAGPSTSRRAHCHTTSDNDNDDVGYRSGEMTHDVEGHSTALETGSDSPVDLTRNGLGRYRGKRGRVASHAIPHLLSVAIRKGAYQGQDVYFKWARREYIRAWKKLYPKIKYKRPPRHLLRLMILRISGLRSDIKKRVRPLMARLHKLRNPGSSDERLERNRQVCHRLLPNAFHCLNFIADKDYYKHPHLTEVISEAFFGHPESPVILHHKDYKLMPLPAVALVLMMMQECLQEWDTGCLRVRDNHCKQQRAVFDAHLHGLNTYQGKARGRLADLQYEWFVAGMEHAGIRVVEASEEQDLSQDFCQPVSRACFIESDSDSEPTPEPEPEPEPSPEPEYNEYGYQTAQSKGKGKAKNQTNDDPDDFDNDLDEDDFEQDHGY
ncbi:hypothetical protein FRC09_003196 [Ceratobasidium sp. 395]|nr:hypothetical protein FRC09_003196 [Ceratobasidium sp. 395]